jgi:hypothetical protein
MVYRHLSNRSCVAPLVRPLFQGLTETPLNLAPLFIHRLAASLSMKATGLDGFGLRLTRGLET